MKILSVDIGGTAIKSAVFSKGILSDQKEIPSEGAKGADYVLKNLYSLIENYKDFDAIGVCTTGQVNPDTGDIVCENENIPGYGGLKLGTLLHQKYQVPVLIENDVNAAALGEYYYGAGEGIKDFLCLTYGTGIGGAIIIDGQLYRGHDGFSGEVGHIITHPKGKPCNCGNFGCYEAYASSTAFIDSCKEYDSSLTNGYLVFEAVKKGNKDVIALLNQWIDEIMYGLITLNHIFNPSHILLGGGIMEQEYIINRIRENLSTFSMDGFKDVQVTGTKLRNQAGLYGMAAVVERKLNS